MPRPASPRRARPAAYAGAARRRTTVAGAVTTLVALLACLVPGVLGTPGGRAAAAPTAGGQDALTVEIDQLPTHVPARGRVRITGTVTNVSDQEWRAVNLHVFRSSSPIVDSPSLAASAAIDAGADVGDRLTQGGTFDTVEVLQPGQTARFSIRFPAAELGLTSPGVYWIGLHAMGESDDGRDAVADGRARTFIPVVEPRGGIDVGVVVPVRGNVWFDEEGRVDDVARWRRQLAPGGRLDTLVNLAGADGGDQLSWLVDPAVLAAVSRLAAGNPPRTLEPVPSPKPGDGTTTESPEGTTGDAEGGAGSTEADLVVPVHPEGVGREEMDEETAFTADLARRWLDDITEVLEGADVMALPYGDLDVNAAARHRPRAIGEAVVRSEQVVEQLGITARPVVAPRTGLISAKALARIPEDTLVLASEAAFTLPPEAPGSTVEVAGRTVVLTSAAAASGGPGPTAADHPLALRQRLVSEAALRLNADSPAPVVLVLPDVWRPEDPSLLLDGLTQPWLRLVRVEQTARSQPEQVDAETLSYADADATEELPEYVFSRSVDLSRKAALLDEVLAERTTVLGQYGDETFVGLSEGRRAHPQDSALDLSRATSAIATQLASITVEAPKSVTLTSANGTVGATVVNGIDQPVLVRITADTDGGLEVADGQEARVAGNARHRLLLDVHATRQGRHDVELVVTSADGRPLGARTPLPLRSSIVSDEVWLVVGGGAALLFVVVLYRIVRRIRGVRAGDPVRPTAPEDQTDPTDPAEPSREGA